MKFLETPLAGVVLAVPKAYEDARGFFMETYRQVDFDRIGCQRFVQDNHSRSLRGVLRGLHLQTRQPQGKLIRVVRGCIWDVVADVDPGSPTFRRWYATELSDDNRLSLYVPPGYAHGFVTLSELADVTYKCTSYYDPDGEVGLVWDDSELAIDWPVGNPILSERDRLNMSLADYLKLLEGS